MHQIFSEKSKGSKTAIQQKEIIRLLARTKHDLTVHDITKVLNISTPTAIKMLNELVEMQLVGVTGKKQTSNGRKPLLYHVNHNHFYAVSVEILLKRISVSMIDLALNVSACQQNSKFVLENNRDCLNQVLAIIQNCVDSSGIPKKNIFGAGISITGRVNNKTGESFNYFHFLDQLLSVTVAEHLQIPVFVDNDTRCVGRAEKIIGKARSVQNSIIINLSRGLGTCLVVDGIILNGGSGFAGEFGHMQFGNENQICICGKSNCLGTEVSGYALEEQMKEKLGNGHKSIIEIDDLEHLRYDNILDAALNGDALSIELLQNMGNKMGKALGNIVNLLNPESIVISGKFARLESILIDSIKMGMTMTALTQPLSNCAISFSELDATAGLVGAGAFVFEQYGLID